MMSGLERILVGIYSVLRVHQDTGTTKYRNTEIQRYRDTEIQRYRESWIQKYRNTGI